MFNRGNQKGKLVRIKLNSGQWLEFSPTLKSSTTGTPNKNKMEYKGIKPGVDLIYTLNENRLKEDIVLQQVPESSSFSFSWDQKGLKYEKDAEGIIWFKDAKTGNKLFCFDTPYAEDAEGNITEKVELSISADTITTTVDETWLKNAKYPVRIDPTVAIQPGTDDSQDTWVSSTNPNTYYYMSSYLHAGTHPNFGTTRTYIKFKYLPSLPTGAKITNAYLGAYMYLAVSPDSTVINCQPITSNWQSYTTNWNKQPSYSSTVLDSKSGTTNNEWLFNITSLVNQWYQVPPPTME